MEPRQRHRRARDARRLRPRRQVSPSAAPFERRSPSPRAGPVPARGGGAGATRGHTFHLPMLKTEAPSESHPDLDQYPVERLVDAFIGDQALAVHAVGAAAPRIAEAVSAAVPRIAAGGRLIYVGAGTSGRLGVLDSVELFPTFSWPRARALGVLAGGRSAM